MSNNEQFEGYEDFLLESSIKDVTTRCTCLSITINHKTKLYLVKKENCILTTISKHDSFEAFEELLNSLEIEFTTMNSIVLQ